MDQEEGTLSKLVEDKEEIPKNPRDNGSTPLQDDPQQPQPRRSNHGNVPRCCFEIEGEAFMITSQDDDEPRLVQEALLSFVSDEWMKAMNDKMKSMKTN